MNEWIALSNVNSFTEFEKYCRDRLDGLDKILIELISKELDRMSSIVRGNESCYARNTAEKTRVIQWPNNPKISATDPDHYFDIYKDYCYNKTTRFITSKTAIGSAGSCFALRIAHQLQLWGYNYVIEEDDLPLDFPLDQLTSTSYRMGPARSGTLFNAPSMRQMVERAFGEWNPEPIVTNINNKLRDPFRSITPTYDDEKGYFLDYKKHTEALRRALTKCDVFVFTLGLTEAWQFSDSGDYTSISPWQVEPSLLRKKNLTVQDNIDELERMFEVYKRHRPGIKLIISVSPVPLNKTFEFNKHVVEANNYSKSVLRVAAEEFTNRYPEEVFYFPSYEMVLYGTKNPWEKDMRHVSSEAVSRVMRLFQKMYLVNQNDLDIAFVKEGRAPKRQYFKIAAKRILRILGLR